MQSHLVGRRAEWAHLRQRLDQTAEGTGGIVLLSGDAGVGKTRMAMELARYADAPVLRGQAEQGRTAPYAPLVGALRSFLHSRPDAFDGFGPLHGHLAQLLPELGQPVPNPDRATLFEAVRGAFAQLGRGLVVLEDLQWSDEATLELLAALAQPLSTLPLLVLATYRSDGLPRQHGIRRLRNDLRRAGLLDDMTLRELDRAETAEVLARALGSAPSPSLAAAIHDRTAGIPFFIEELAGALSVTGALRQGELGLELAEHGEVPLPDSVRDAVLMRALELSGSGRRAAEVAAVAGDGFDLRVVVALANEEGLAELLETGIVREEDGVGRFRHALTCEALYGDIPWTARRRLHAQIAEALERRGAAPREIAPHWAGARDDERARNALLAAARESESMHAYRDAAELRRQALDLWPETADPAGRADALAGYARCSELAGDLNEAARSWRELVIAADDDELRARAQRSLASVHELRGDGAAAVTARLDAAAMFTAAGRLADGVAEQIAVANHRQYESRLADAVAIARQAQADASTAGRLDLRVRALAIEGMVLAKIGDDYDAGVDMVRTALALALEHNLSSVTAELYQQLSVALYQAADYPNAEVALETAVELCERNPDPETLAVCMSCLAYVLAERGEWSRASEICRAMLDADQAAFVANGVLGVIRAREGRFGLARRLLSDAIAFAERRHHYNITVIATAGLARVAAAEGDIAEASTRARDLLALWERSEDRHYAVGGLRWAAGFFATAGDVASAHACADALARIASSGHAVTLAALAYAIGECALAEGDEHTSAEHLCRAFELHRELDLPFERAEIAFRAGVALATAGERDLALERLSEAHRVARLLGARPLAAAAANEVAGLGESVRDRLGVRATSDTDGVGLTPRERDVLRLVTLGQTNREIARELFLSQRTVDMHVRNVLRKLDCRSRVEAAVRARELELVAV
jgi:predicted ATPase/DNA-binding CsgD family transcriptional regulator